ncbi:MAG: hypothetical protein JWQ09_63 [Segetibacter sp.]|nr:hypothetical protein [Segetibacter sp.]
MKALLLLLSTQLLIELAHSQGVITVQHGTTTKLESRLDVAITNAQSGDLIYLPGGLIAGSDGVNITKPLTLVGAGYHQDSSKATGITVFAGEVNFNSGATGSSITGIFSTFGINIYSSNITVSRCNVSGIQMQGPISDVFIEENIINGRFYLYAGQYSNILFRKNILYSYVYQYNMGGILFSNNIFLGNSFDCRQNSFQNNIFIKNDPSFSSSNQFINNLFVCPEEKLTGQSNTSGNIFYEPIGNIFENYTSSYSWSKTENFHLKPGCKGIGLGTDGSDAGIYGTSSAFKDGGLPANPHYQSAVIPNSTNSSGKLNINITVKAQNN